MEVGCLKHPGASSISSHILDGDFSHGWQILATQPWAPTPSQSTPELSAISSEKWGSWQMQVIVEVRDHEHHTCFQVSSATERILSTANMPYLTSTPWPLLGGQEYQLPSGASNGASNSKGVQVSRSADCKNDNRWAHKSGQPSWKINREPTLGPQRRRYFVKPTSCMRGHKGKGNTGQQERQVAKKNQHARIPWSAWTQDADNSHIVQTEFYLFCGPSMAP